MLTALLHGLGIRKQPTPPGQTFNVPIIDAHLAPLGKSYGTYIIDSLSTPAVITTKNLPDVTGYLKNTQADFLLERLQTPNGDFIVAQAEPKFPSHLGTPVIDPQYLDALRGRKFIAYQKADKSWTPWKEIGAGVNLTAKFQVTTTPVELTFDPCTIRDYFIEIEPGGIVDFVVGAEPKFTHPINIVLAPVSATYYATWPAGLIWTNDAQTPPANLAVGTRLHVELRSDNKGQIQATDTVYRV
jgi:hypothetical protein